jgi:protein-S-isoprenylcysteine O-methyltransferase Ste14
VIAIKTLIFTILAPGTVTVLVPYLLVSSSTARFSVELGTLRYFGLIPLLVGAATYAWCAWEFVSSGRGTPAPVDPPKELVVQGLYQHVRNPMYVMYVGVLSILLGEVLLFQSALLFAYTALVLLAFHLFVVSYEEPTLGRKFGESYARYRSSVPRWLPRLKRR